MRMHKLLALALVLAAAHALPLAAQAPPPADTTAGSSLHLGLQAVQRLRESGVAEPRGRMLVAVGQDGRPAISFAESNVADSLRAAVLPLVREFLAARSPSTLLQVSIRLESLAPFTRLAPGRERQPVPTNLARFRDVLESVANAHPEGAVDVTATVRMLISARGEAVVVEAALTGDPHVDRNLAAAAHSLRFRPATVGGRATQVWVQMPLLFRTPS